ncbi:hypothetical protein [Paenibacillus sp. MSJ-34]|uniref:hypothetical protein n=1 Tax=Paenibacillus sp. MSJ-34 TaxID=2841529 RepID=UPI001C125B2D|nr:hypothetical protein [Paenibacillus sp. MSJ-34]MBU5442415.1 hypothetical protein [Paenibacillus sp. MSJ-34]
MPLSEMQSEALEMAKKHGGRLIRWKGGFWTFEGARPSGERHCGSPTPEWYCTTNTVFALVRRGLMVMYSFECCYVKGGAET